MTVPSSQAPQEPNFIDSFIKIFCSKDGKTFFVNNEPLDLALRMAACMAVVVSLLAALDMAVGAGLAGRVDIKIRHLMTQTRKATEGVRDRCLRNPGTEIKQMHEYLQVSFNLDPAKVQAAAGAYSIKVGEIVEESLKEPKAVIQDPAGSAVGTGEAPEGGGLSGAIYKAFKLAPVPDIRVGQSVFGKPASGSRREEIEDAKRVLHTHSPHLSRAENLEAATLLIKEAYKEAIETFLTAPQYKILNLCAISAAIYAGKFKDEDLDHLHPSITQVALTAAIAEIQSERPKALEGKTINLYYRPIGAVASVAKSVHEVLAPPQK